MSTEDRRFNAKREVERLLRRVGLEQLIYHYVFLKDARRHRDANRAFIDGHPEFSFPPAMLRFDVTSTTSAEYFFTSGRETAGLILAAIDAWCAPAPLRVCEWGCGLGRILFPLAELAAGRGLTFVGTDAHPPSVRWAQQAGAGRIDFLLNSMQPPLPLEAGSVDFAYAISVFTHLSEELSAAWMAEIFRILGPGGVFLFSTNSGRHHRGTLPREQEARLERGEFAEVRSSQDGSQMYVGIHCPQVVRSLAAAAGAEVLEHRPDGNQGRQDIWILRKPAASPAPAGRG